MMKMEQSALNDAKSVRDQSLRGKADEVNGYLNDAHGMMDMLEAALFGPQPREIAAKGQNPGNEPEPYPGVSAAVADASTGAATLLGRLRTMYNSL